MTTAPAIRKVFQGVADRRQMYCMFDRHAGRTTHRPNDGTTLYCGEWFEIGEAEHDYMFAVDAPLWIRGSMFALRQFLTGTVTSVFFALRIDDAIRYFHGYCDLSDHDAVEVMRLAIIERESRPVRAMTRDERLEHIWSSTAELYRGYTGDRWPNASRGQRTVLFFGGKLGSVPRLLDSLTDEEVATKLPVHLRYLPDAAAA